MTDLKPNDVGGISDPVNITILNVNDKIRQLGIKPVTSVLIFEPSTQYFQPDGLFSEEIFGKVGSPDRLRKFGYIALNTQIFSPKIFRIISQLGSLYVEIMAGKTYAIFDTVEKNFVRITGDPNDTPEADTGFSFFLRHFKDIVYKRTDSDLRDERIAVVKQYQDVEIYENYLVLPAGLRDIKNDTTGRLIQDEINTLYLSLIMLTRAIPKGSTSDLYDPVRYQIQSKCLEIYEYIENMVSGKRGFFQGSFARRKVAYGTRNVISAAPMTADRPDSPQMLKSDEAMVGTFQTMKAFQPPAIFFLNTTFLNVVFGTDGSTRIPLIDLKTKQLVPVVISEREKWLFTTSDGIESLINRFENHDIRKNPVLVTGEDGVGYGLYLVYDEGDKITLARSLTDLKDHIGNTLDPKLVRFLTWIELFYMVATFTTIGRHTTNSRYPIINGVGDLPAKVHVMSTNPGRIVTLHNLVSPEHAVFQFPEYPIMGGAYFDIMAMHPSTLAGFGGDSIPIT